jgi:N-acetylmuramoyl-L-alanine amidase
VLDGIVEAPVEWLEFPPAALPPNPQIGTLAMTSSYDTTPGFPNRIDLALVRLTLGAVDPMIRWLGRISGVRDAPLTVGEKVQLCGYGTSRLHTADWDGVTQGEVKELSSRQTFDYPGVGTLGFTELVLCTRFTEDADSGAAVVDSQNRLVGIHLGASGPSVSNPWSAFQAIGNVQLLFNVSLVSQVATPLAPALALALASAPTVAPQPGARPAPPTPHRASAIDTMARTLWGEARGEPPEGRVGIANVIANRALFVPPGRFGGDVEAVCLKNAQFSCWNADDPNRQKLLAISTTDPAFAACLDLATLVVDGRLADNTFGSSHYHEISIKPDWAVGHFPVVRLGRHDFYNDIQ